MSCKTTSCNKLFVGNLDYNATREELELKFGAHGPVREAKIILDNEGRSRGYAFVTFKEAKHAQVALEKMNAIKIGQRAINVDLARPRDGHRLS